MVATPLPHLGVTPVVLVAERDILGQVGTELQVQRQKHEAHVGRREGEGLGVRIPLFEAEHVGETAAATSQVDSDEAALENTEFDDAKK